MATVEDLLALGQDAWEECERIASRAIDPRIQSDMKRAAYYFRRAFETLEDLEPDDRRALDARPLEPDRETEQLDLDFHLQRKGLA